MLKSVTAAKVKAFQGYASCPWTQDKAEELWQDKLWKLSLSLEELFDLSEGWIKFVVDGDADYLNEACAVILKRLS